MNLTIRDDAPRLEKMLSCLRYLKDHQVQVGLPSSADPDLAFILAIQEHGSPVMRIPPRPVVQPALSRESTREAMGEAAASALSAALSGDLPGTQAGLESVGQSGADGIRSYIDEGVSASSMVVTPHRGDNSLSLDLTSGEIPPLAVARGSPTSNAPVTVSGGWIYNRVAKTGVHVPGKGFNKPLYDTGRLYRAFSYEVVRR